MATTQCGPRPRQTGQLIERLMGYDRDRGPKNQLNEREERALRALSRSMLRTFINEPSPALSCVLEASAVSSFADCSTYKDLFEKFVNVIAKGIGDSNLLNYRALDAFNLVLRSPQSLESKVPLESALRTLQTRLVSAITDSDGIRQHRLLCTLSAVLDNMNEIKTSGLSQEVIHAPLLELLDKLGKSQELRLAQAAQYAYQALLGIPSNESPWKTLWNQFCPVVQGAAQVGGAVFTLDPSKLVDGLLGVQNLIPLVESVVNVIQSLSSLPDNISNAGRGIRILKKQKSWYFALRFTYMMIHSNARSQLERLLPLVPCAEEKEFLCGLCAQLDQARNTGGSSMREGVIPILKDFLAEKGKRTKYPRVQEWVRLVASISRQTTSKEPVNWLQRKLFREKKYLHTIEFSQKQNEALPGELLNKAWLSCDEVRVFYADLAVLEHYTSNSKNLLKIERLTGTPLPMDQCYINLATVTYSAGNASNSGTRDEGEILPQFSLLSRMRAEDPPKSSQYTLPELFKRDKHAEDWPKRILIRGQAGVGKSTLCKKMVHDYIHGDLWNEFFDRVLWVPLRKLKGRSVPGYNLEYFLRDEYLSECEDREDLSKALQKTIHCNDGRTLFILDGLDEVAQDLNLQSSDFLRELLHQRPAIITSRPYGINQSAINDINLTLETVGFYPDQVDEYIQKNAGDKVAEIQAFIKEHWIIQGLARIPIQLDALCYCWGTSLTPSNNVPTTMATLYRAVERSLWNKDIEQLEKSPPGKSYSLSKTDAHRAPSAQILSLVQGEISVLQALAFTGLYSNVVEFDVEFRNDVLKPQNGILSSTGPASWCNDLEKLSFLRTSDIGHSSDSNYHFLHLTYQEYFAAQYFVEHWKSDKKLICLNLRSGKKESIEPKAFLQREKYKAGYDIMWRFTCGLLQEEKDDKDLCRFFKILEAEPRDLLGPAHQRLSMHCFSEVTDLSKGSELCHLRESMEHELSLWLLFECKFSGGMLLGTETECPDHLFVPLLQSLPRIVFRALQRRSRISSDILNQATFLLENGSSRKLKITALRMLVNYHKSVPEAILPAVASLFQAADPEVRWSAAYALSGQSALPEAILLTLVSLLQDRDTRVRRAVAYALSEQLALPENILLALVSLFQAADPDVRQATVYALGKQSVLPEVILLILVSLLQDSDLDVRSNAAHALSKQSALPENIFLALVSLLQDNNPNVRSSAVEALHGQSALLEAILLTLVSLLQDSDANVRSNAAQALSEQSGLSEAIILAIISLLQDDDPNVRSSAAYALREQSAFSEAILPALVPLLQDNNPNIRSSAAEALYEQLALPEAILLLLVQLLQDNDPGVRFSAALALSHQSAIPEAIILSLVPLLQDDDSGVRLSVAQALRRQSVLPEAILLLLVQLLQDNDSGVRLSTVYALREQSTLPKGVFKALALLLQNEEISHDIENALNRHQDFYSILPELNIQCLKSLFAIWARRSFYDQLSCYLWEDYLCIDTPEGLRRVPLTNMVECAIQEAQQDWRIKFQELTAGSE